MILKIGYGNELPLKLFRYVEDCENVQVCNIDLKRLVTEYKNHYSNKQTFEDIKSFLDFRISEFEKKHKNQKFTPSNVIGFELYEIFLKVCGHCGVNKADINALIKIVEALLQDKLDDNTLACTDVKMVTYEKNGSTFGIIRDFQFIYLLNNNGKTIEIIR